jgi:hypothetical protein
MGRLLTLQGVAACPRAARSLVLGKLPVAIIVKPSDTSSVA